MRCTEGVWLSLTPTKDCLIVAMDFEGENNVIAAFKRTKDNTHP